MAELIIYSGKLKGRRLILPDQRDVVIGRDEDCHMRIASTLVSRKHCILKAGPEGIHVRDLQSQNGTYVNDVAVIDSFLMKPGDVLRVGAALFQVPQIRSQATTQPSGQLSDDEISSWISDQEQTIAPSKSDTTVIKGRQPAPSASSLAAPGPTQSPTPSRSVAPTQRLSVARTIKEQAAEIIQRHWDMLREKG